MDSFIPLLLNKVAVFFRCKLVVIDKNEMAELDSCESKLKLVINLFTKYIKK